MHQLVFFYPGGRRRAVTFSYDDGRANDRKLVEILNRHGLRATFNLVPGWLDGALPNCVARGEVSELYCGHEIANHTLNHPFLENLNSAQVAEEVLEARRQLEMLAGYPVPGFAYPFGTRNENIVAQLTAAGVAYARTASDTRKFQLPPDWMAWQPTSHHCQATELVEPFFAYPYTLALFHIWGHSNEIDADNSFGWNEFERLCQLVANHADTWYATNLQIVRYIKAIRTLVFSADNKLVYNPSAETIWFECHEKLSSVAPGEYLSLK